MGRLKGKKRMLMKKTQMSKGASQTRIGYYVGSRSEGVPGPWDGASHNGEGRALIRKVAELLNKEVGQAPTGRADRPSKKNLSRT
jgi:hypothetical protein